MKRYDVVAAGRAYTDIISPVSADFLRKWDIPQNGDRQFDIGDLRQIQADLKNSQMRAGGPSGNTTSTIAALGGTAGFFGKVNSDEAGNFYLRDFHDRGVDFINSPYDRTANLSPTCLVLETEDGSRSFAYNPGCADTFSDADFTAYDFSSTKFFLVEAHLLTSGHAGKIIEGAIAQAKKDCRIVLNLQGITYWKQCPKIANYVFREANIIIGNEIEQSNFSEALDNTYSPDMLWVITKGENGAEARIGTNTHCVCAIPPKVFKGSTGAGDGFAAGFLLGLSRGVDIPVSLQCGVRAATAILGEESGRPADKTPGIWAHLMHG